jgi:hypothetical protein
MVTDCNHLPTSWDEQNRALTRVIKSEAPNAKPDGAHLLEHEGKRYVAPWSTTARCWAASDDFRFTYLPVIVNYFDPKVLQNQLKSQRLRLKIRSHIFSPQPGISRLDGLPSFNQLRDYGERVRMVPLISLLIVSRLSAMTFPHQYSFITFYLIL